MERQAVRLCVLVLLTILSLSLAPQLVNGSVSFSMKPIDENLSQQRPLISHSPSEELLQTFGVGSRDPGLDVSRFDVTGMCDMLGLDFAPGEIIVKYRDVVAKADYIQSLNQKSGVNSVERVFAIEASKLSKIYKLTFDYDADVLSLTREYSSDPNIEYAEPNYIFSTSATPNDFYYDQQWAHQVMESELAWDVETGRSNVVIAIVDTGVDWNHPDLASNIWNNTDEAVDGIDTDGNGYIDDVRGYDFVDTTMEAFPGEDSTVRDNDPMDFYGHGTHCAGIAAAVTNNSLGVAGMSWNCSIMPVRAGFKTPNSRGILESDDAAMAIEYAADNNATIISMSWGSYSVSSIIRDAIDYAISKGVVLFGAVGNDNYYGRSYPAGYDGVVSVAATSSSDHKAWFSNFGSWVDVAAPGVDVLSTIFDDDYAIKSGTSMAAPYAASLAALVLSKNLSLSKEEVLNILRSTCYPVDSAEYIGMGRINAYRALQRDTIPLVNLDSSLEDANAVGTLSINGTAYGDNFKEYTVEYGSGTYPASWTLINRSTVPVTNGTLAEWNTSLVPTGKYAIRLTAFDVDDERSEDQVIVFVKTSSIQKAINEAVTGDVVLVEPGTYYENAVVNKSVTLLGADAETTIIDGGPYGSVVKVTAPNVTVSGLTIRGASDGIEIISSGNNITGNIITENEWGIHVSSANNNITGNTIMYNYFFGIDIEPADYLPSESNNIADNNISFNRFYSIRISGSGNNVVDGNNIVPYEDEIPIALYWYSNGYGYLYSNNNIISNNNITGGYPGIELAHSSNNTISENCMGGYFCMYLHDSSNNNHIVSNNVAESLIGLAFIYSDDNIVDSNIINDNVRGIIIMYSSNNNISRNSIERNGISLIFTNSSNNRIYHNNFLDNYQQPDTDAESFTVWDNDYPSGGNYWSDLEDVDIFLGAYQDQPGSDGILDHPYILDEDNQDLYPLVKPWNTQPLKFGVNYFSTHNHYEPRYLSDKELERDFQLFSDQELKYITLCAIWKYLEPELGVYNETAIDDLVRVCDFAAKYNMTVIINFHTMMSNDSWTMPEWLSPRKFEAVFLNETVRQAWLNFLDHVATRLDDQESIWSWHMMNEPWRREWACNVSIDEFIQLWTEMKAVFKAYSDRPVSVRFAAQAFEDPNHFNSDPRIYSLFDYLALDYYEVYCPSENLTRIVSEAQQSGCRVVISEFGSNATDDADQASDYQRILKLFRNLRITDCIAWMWRADHDNGGPDLPGVGWNLAKDVNGTPRPAFLLLENEHELAITVEGSGSTFPAVGSYNYTDGTEVNVTATPETGWMFDKWTFDGEDVGGANPYVAIMNSPHSLTAVFTCAQCSFEWNLSAGWNMMSFPCILPDANFSNIFDGASFYQALTWNGASYVDVSAGNAEPGWSYWVLVLEDTNVTVTNGIPVESYELDLPAGWSMIGSIYGKTVNAADVFPDFYQLLTWDGTGYVTTTMIEPGKGYWTLVLEPTHITVE